MSGKVLAKLEQISDEQIKTMLSETEKLVTDAVKDPDLRSVAFEHIFDFKMGLLQSRIATDNS